MTKKTYTYIETEIEVKYTTTLGDNGEFTKDEIEEIAQGHTEEYARENNISLADIRIKKVRKY